MDSLVRSCRASLVLASAFAACSVSASSSSSAALYRTSSLRRLTTTAPALAAKTAPKRPAQKKKLTTKKNPFNGPRSIGAKRKGASRDANVAAGTLTNAHYRRPVDMSSLPTLSPETVNDNVSRPAAFGEKALDAFQKFGIERKLAATLTSYIRPLSVVRDATLKLYNELDASASYSSSPKKLVINGSQSTGKSHLVLQAVSHALSSEWLVVYLPQLIHWINSTSQFIYSPVEQAYLQPDIVKTTLSAILAVNYSSGVLAKIKVTSEDLEQEPLSGVDISQQDASLLDLLRAATSSNVSPLSSQRLFDALLSVLARQSDVPVLFALDHLQALYLSTKYRNPDYEIVQSYELAPIRSLIRFLARDDATKRQGGVKRGTVLAAVSRSHSEWQPGNELEVVLNQELYLHPERVGRGPDADKRLDAYARIDAAHLEHAKSSGWSVFQLPRAHDTAPGGEQWPVSELKALYEVRRSESRSWSVPSAVFSSAAWPPRMHIAQQAMFDRAAGGMNATGTGGTTEDELFLMRVIDSGRNPLRFDRALRGTSLM